MRHRRGQFYAQLLGGAAAISLMAAGTASAQSARDFNIPSQPLSSALTAFGEQSRMAVLFTPEVTNALVAPAIVQTAEPEAALQAMLAGTGLTYRRNGDTFIVMAQEGGSPQAGRAAGASTVEALIVTAQKREEDIQDVPIAISAFSQEALETHQIAGGPDLITQVPNMTFTKTNFSSYSVQLRGIGTQAISATTDPGVAVAFNNQPFIQNRFFEQEFYDLQRVEVLRGPQGTLYGRNATAGVVNIISQKPRFIYEAKLSGDVANYNSTRLEGMVNIPLVEDVVALRMAGAWTKRDGYATNELNGNPIDGRDLWSTRVSLRVSPSSAFDMNLIWEHFEEDDDRIRSGKQLCKKHIVTEVGGVPVTFNQTLPAAGQTHTNFAGVQPTYSQGCERVSLYSEEAFQTPNGASVPYYVPLGAIGLPIALFDPYTRLYQSKDLRLIESTIDPEYRAEADVGELLINWDVTDKLTLTSETGYAADFVYSLQDFNRFNTAPGAWDASLFGGQPRDYVESEIVSPDGFFCDPQLGCSDRLVAVDVSTAESRQFNQEFRLASDFDGPFNFSLGANFTRFDLNAKYYVFINSLTLAALVGNAQTSFDGQHPYEPGVSDNSECLKNGRLPGDPLGAFGYTCVYVEPNSIGNIQDYGHNYFLSTNPYKLVSYAVFGETYYNVAKNLKITGGLRWTVDKKYAPRVPSWTFVGDTVGYPVLEVIEQEWREPTGRLAIDWKPDLAFTDETMVYASYAHGYKAGGANPPPMTPVGQSSVFYGREHISETRPKTFDAEFIDAFELGAKNTLADGRMTLNLAAFYYDYTDYQISEIVDRSAFNRNFDATIWGIEIEADWRPLENLKLGFKGGYESTKIADGERAIDLMDRTAGNPDWVLHRPFPTFASSCVLPVWVSVQHETVYGVGQIGGGGPGGCELAYQAGLDPVSGREYEPNPQNLPFPFNNITDYPGFNPLDDSQGHNFGEGFFKDLSGNHLPNAPEFTATFTADYTLPLSSGWLATLHTDLYWQSESWWRVFDDHEYNKLDEYFTMNLAAIFNNNEDGWRVMAYVKNVFDRDSITGAFLNSDDTALTTNVFLTEPRLYGLRVTKEWAGGPLLGSFGQRREGPYPFTLELGGQVQRHDAPNDAVAPSFLDAFSPTLDPLGDQQDDLDWGDGREVRLTWRPAGEWTVGLGTRFGKTNGSMPWSVRREEGDRTCLLALYICQVGTDEQGPLPYIIRENYTISSTSDREEHTVVDFAVGREIGFGTLSASAVSAGVRYADISSTTNAHIFGVTNWDIPPEDNLSKYNGNPPPFGRPRVNATWDRFDAMLTADRRFNGFGPVLNWEASKALLGDRTVGVLGVDWSLTGGVLFGERKTSITGEEVEENFIHDARAIIEVGQNAIFRPDFVTPTPVNIRRSEDVTVPTFGASLGLSYRIDRFSIGAGYRWERYQDAIDGGFTETQEEDRTIDGPYLKISVGFGGG